MNKKVAIVCDFLVKMGGAQQVLLKISEIYPDAPIYCLLYDEKGTKGKFAGKKIIQSNLASLPRFRRKKVKLLLPYLPKAVESFDLSTYDIVISSSDSYAHGAITKPATFHLCYCHTPMRYVWDWYHEYLVENNVSTGLKGLIVRNLLHKIRIWDKVAADRPDLYLANSENVRERIMKYYRQDAHVLYPPVDIENITPNYKAPDEYYLIISRLEPYKKIDLAIRAFNGLGKKLKIVGEGSQLNYLKSISDSNIEFFGFKTSQELLGLVQNCKGLIFPGEDDFGITVIEAMAAGRPVIAFKKGGALETITEGKTGILFDEPTPKSIGEAVLKLEKNYQNFDSHLCRAQAENFSVLNFKTRFEREVEEGYQNHLVDFGVR